MSRPRRYPLTLALVLVGAAYASSLQGQQPPAGAVPDSAQAVETQQTQGSQETQEAPRRPSPGGAFLRSLVVPGWGQVASGSPQRGTFYFTVESMSLWMILKTSKTLGSARDILAMRRFDAEERLIAEGSIDPSDLPAAIDADQGVADAFNLEQLRAQQREDWITFGVFFLLLGGADAFVAAHLADFPEPLQTVIRPLPDMGIELGFRLAF